MEYKSFAITLNGHVSGDPVYVIPLLLFIMYMIKVYKSYMVVFDYETYTK